MAHAAKTNGDLKKSKILGKVDKSVGNYEKHPFFIKKANEAKAILKTTGLPKEFVRSK